MYKKVNSKLNDEETQKAIIIKNLVMVKYPKIRTIKLFNEIYYCLLDVSKSLGYAIKPSVLKDKIPEKYIYEYNHKIMIEYGVEFSGDWSTNDKKHQKYIPSRLIFMSVQGFYYLTINSKVSECKIMQYKANKEYEYKFNKLS